MNKFDNFLNSLSDKNWTWWPILSAKPEKHQKMQDWVILGLALPAGTLAGFTPIPVHMAMTGGELSPMYFPVGAVVGIGLLFFGYKLSFARSWNLRADRIRATANRGLISIERFQIEGGRGPRNTPEPFPSKRGPSGKAV